MKISIWLYHNISIVIVAKSAFIYLIDKEQERAKKINTWRSLFRRDFAKDRHGVTILLEEFIFVTYSSSEIRTASSNM